MKPSSLKIEQTFDIFDRDSSGSIDIQELDKVLKTLGQKITESEEVLVTELDKDGDGQIDFDEFASPSIISNSQTKSDWEFVKQLQEQAIAHQAFNHPYLQIFKQFEAKNITWRNYEIGDGGELSCQA